MVYWIVSVPYEDSRTKSFKRLKKQLTQDQKLCDCNEYKIPKLRVGTLDQLVGLSDDLIKYDAQVEGATMKILRQLGEVSGSKEEDFVPEIIMQEDNSAPVELYLNFFQWDENQYLTTKPLRELTEVITKKVHKYDEELRVKASEFSVLKSNIQALERKRQGGLTVRLLDGIIKKEQVVESEYLTTLFVAVPKSSQRDWEKTYDKMDNIEFIVPDSSELIVDENDYSLYSVVLIRKKVDDFKTACHKRKYVVRDFEYDDEKFKLSLLEKDKMIEKLESERKELYEWCKVAFSECFSAWIHLKAIRTYVESVLRYGLPVRFVSLLLKVSKNEKKIHKFFRDNYSHLQEDEPAVSNEEMLIATAQYGDFYPYVLLTINTNYPYLSTKL